MLRSAFPVRPEQVKPERQDDSPSCPLGLVGIAFVVAVLGDACDRGGSENPPGVEDVPAARFAFEVRGAFQPPPGDGFWEPADIVVSEGRAVPGGRPGSEGRVWVVDRRANRIYHYDLHGKYIGRSSRGGGGPGELSGAMALGIVGDTLWVHNAGNRRIDYFDPAGHALATQPLPEGAGSILDMIAVGDDFVASAVFGPAPLVRFRRSPQARRIAPAAGFGLPLSAQEARMSGGAPGEAGARGPRDPIPSIYRLELVAGRIWAFHLYLPLIGIFEPGGNLVRIVTYPADPVAAGDERVQEVDGSTRRVRKAPPTPGGAIGILRGSSGQVYLLTHQASAGRQRLYVMSDRGDLVGRVESPLDGWMAFSAASGRQRFVIATLGVLEEPAVIRMAAGSD